MVLDNLGKLRLNQDGKYVLEQHISEKQCHKMSRWLIRLLVK